MLMSVSARTVESISCVAIGVSIYSTRPIYTPRKYAHVIVFCITSFRIGVFFITLVGVFRVRLLGQILLRLNYLTGNSLLMPSIVNLRNGTSTSVQIFLTSCFVPSIKIAEISYCPVQVLV
jgi:hypothetical protein